MAKANKRNIGWKILMGAVFLGLLVMAGFRLYEWWIERQAHFVRYEAFGIEVPTNYEIHGIDVSKYQEAIDWESVKGMNVEGIKLHFAFIKATEGNGNEDRYFKRNWKKIKDAGMVRGAYHFFIASKSGKTQAENFISSVELQPGDLPPVLDVEQTNGQKSDKIRQRVQEWLTTVENYYGVKPIIYTNVDFYKQILKDDFDHYPLWVAHYLQKEKPRIYRDWHFWQYSEQGRVNGILSKTDFNVFNGDSTDFKGLLIN
ncbi:glycoside hydrolase family 25 protein [Pseudoflavitalea sp. G-6-1-2]|uniref:glycoside hydrolase family 25 protein n=1 Tax=Pseudoflavitalea sp. G-6-1-2 TaxID=2728841 RepID=UPI00146F66F2|nr:glycoside hydrolase family 25 protein [Pseudoflavitalea sp. G-6-1-2]NML19907.1 glycoside hydrolase family 25 protein [Pseudoflavitalea sp. G-6-1-2]